MPYAHIRRYAGSGGPAHVDILSDVEVVSRGRRWDLRTGARGPFLHGFAPSRDGRVVRFGERAPTATKTPVEIVHADGRVVPAGDVIAFDGGTFVGEHLVLEIDRKPPVVVSSITGAVVGALPKSTQHVARFNPHDGRTLWCNEESALVQYDVATQTAVRRIDAPKGHVFVGICVTPSGHAVTWQRTRAHHEKLDSAHDAIVVFDDANRRVVERPALGMSFAPLADGLLVSDHRAKQFVVYDVETLEPREVVPMFQPDRQGHAAVASLPSGRGWIAMGGTGPWDHYGEGESSSTSAAKTKTKTKTTAMKKKPAPKKKPAAKKR
jgi:hypothetical protein